MNTDLGTPSPDRLGRSLRKAWLLVRRRGRLMAFVFAATLSLALVGISYAPVRYRAQAILHPQGDLPYPGPLTQLLEDLRDPEVIAGMVAHAQLPREGDLWDRAHGRTTAAERFELTLVQVPRPSAAGDEPTVEVRASVLTPTRDQGTAAVKYLADTLIRKDEAWRTSQPKIQVLPRNEPDYRAQLQALRSSAPEADGTELVRRLRDLRQRIAEAEIKQASLVAREQAAADGLRELDARVSEEATQAYLADLDAQREKARRLAAERQNSGREVVLDPRLQRIADLEAELERMLATRTRRHPEVRELVRRLEVERRAAADAGLAPVEPRVRDGSNDPPGFDPAAFQPGPTPPVWRQRAPSYPGWVSARDEVLDVRQQVAVAKEELNALVGQREALEGAQSRAEETQRELSRLERLAQDQERRLAELEGQQAEAPPLELVAVEEPVRVSLAWVGWRGAVALCLLLAGAVGWAVDANDDSYRLPEEVVELGVPVLGVIPHLKSA